MNTPKSTTYVLLEKGSEDVALYNEINQIFIRLKIQSTKEAVRLYPKLVELKQRLRDEIKSDCT